MREKEWHTALLGIILEASYITPRFSYKGKTVPFYLDPADLGATP